MLTAYDATFAGWSTRPASTCLLVGDSLGMVLQGHASTLPVTLDADGLSHAHAWRAATARAWLIGRPALRQLPGVARTGAAQRGALMQAGAHMVKLEGGGWTAPRRCASWSSAASRCAPTWASRRRRCTRWAATACRAATTRPRPRCAHATRLAERAPRCWCWRWCRPPWPREVHGTTRRSSPSASAPAPALRRPGAGAARHAAASRAASCRASCATSWRATRRASSEAVRRYVAAVKDGSFPDAERRHCATDSLQARHAHRPHHRRTARRRWPHRQARLRARPWATCTRATWRWCARPSRMAAPVVASIFVNRLQFVPHEDFDTLSAHLERDCDMLRSAGCDLLFAPDESELYPEPQTFKVHAAAGAGRHPRRPFRPGFFTGVCTVVMKLFDCVQPRRGGVRQEGLPAADGDPPHGAAVRAADRDRGRRDRRAPTTAWRCRRATAT